MKFQRTYSTPDDPYAGVAFEPRTSRIVNPDGSVIFEAKDVMVPTAWSQVAVDVLAQKYCRKAGVPEGDKPVDEEGVPEWLRRSVADEAALEAIPRDDQFGPERDARQVFNRLAGCWTYWGWKYGYFDSENDAPHLPRRDVRDARAPDRRAQLAAVVQHGLALGVRHLGPGAGTLLRRSARRRRRSRRPIPSRIRRLARASSSESKTTSSTKAASSTASFARRASLRADPAAVRTFRRSARPAKSSPAAERRAA